MTSGHARNTGPMQTSPRCGARTRGGTPCRAPAAHGKMRCRMHGGGRRCGAPRGNRNAQTHGLFTAIAIIEQDQIQALLDDADRTLQDLSCDGRSRTHPDQAILHHLTRRQT